MPITGSRRRTFTAQAWTDISSLVPHCKEFLGPSTCFQSRVTPHGEDLCDDYDTNSRECACTAIPQRTTSMNPPPETAKEIARRFTEGAKENFDKSALLAKDITHNIEDIAHQGSDATKDLAQHATETAKEIYQSAALKAKDGLETTKEYVRKNPLPVVVGALAFGAAIGYLLLSRRKQTFGERYVGEPLCSMRESVLAALAPVTKRVHDEYDSVRGGAGKFLKRAHRSEAGRAVDSLSDRIGRVGNNLKFW